jgi:PAS domain S-box-containing protein
VESVKEYAIFMMDAQGQILTWNSGAEHIKGYRAEEIIGKHFLVFYPPEDIREGKPQQNLQQAMAAGECHDAGWRVRKDKSRFWANVIITALHDEDGALWGYGKVTRDMTAERAAEEGLRKANAALDAKVQIRSAQIARANARLRAVIQECRQAREKLEVSLSQLRSLSARAQVLGEEERKMISRQVHDELGQSLTAIKMDLSWIIKRTPNEDDPVHQRIKSSLGVVDETVRAVRRIAAELRPVVLDDLGLAAAIEWQVEEFQTRTGITFHVRMPPEDIPLDTERATTIFRIFQEVLRNVVQHAKATQVQVRLMSSAGAVILEIRDNGKGISDEQIANSNSLGLLGMKERINLLGGRFAIHGQEGKGTTVVVQMPLEGPTTSRGA